MSPRLPHHQPFHDEDDWLNLFLTELEALPPLSSGEADALLAQARAGDHAAEQRLTEGHLEMVLELARQLQSDEVGLHDLIQEGSLGLVAAIREQMPQEVPFAAYAHVRVLASMRAAVSADADARSAAGLLAVACTQLTRKEEELARRLGRPASELELAQALSWTAERLAEVRTAVRAALDAGQRRSTASVLGEDDVETLIAADGFVPMEDEEEV